jgi:hypothetical protein
MANDPVDDIDGLNSSADVSKAETLAELKAVIRVFANADAVRAVDLSGRTHIMVGASFYEKDTSDVSPDDGVSVIHDDAGNHWLRFDPSEDLGPQGRVVAAGTVAVSNGHRGYQVEATVAGAVTFNLGPFASRTRKFTVALVGADPVAHVIKVVFDGSEECRGSGEFVLTVPYEVVTFHPLAAGGGGFIG